jgi:hypothetical protein
VLAYVWIAVVMIRDRITRGSVHPALLWGGLLVVVEQAGEVLAFDSPWWRNVAHGVYRWLDGSGLV